MPTKAELVTEIYLLLAAIHLHGFVMSPEMAQKIFDRWRTFTVFNYTWYIDTLTCCIAVVIDERPESPEDIMKNFNTNLQQVSESPKPTKSTFWLYCYSGPQE